MKTRYKILSFLILGIAFVTTGFGASYLFSSNPYLPYFDSDAVENLQEVKKFKELYPEATRGSVISEGIRTVKFTYFEHDTSFVYDGPNKTPNNIVLEISYDPVTKSLLDAELRCTFNDTIDISKTIVDSLSKENCFEQEPEPEPVFVGTLLLNNNPEMVKRILDYCNSTGVKLSIGLRSSNGTHIITNNTCEWQTIEKYESDRELNFVLSGCEHTIRSIEDKPASWSNVTHYIDTNNCEWQERK